MSCFLAVRCAPAKDMLPTDYTVVSHDFPWQEAMAIDASEIGESICSSTQRKSTASRSAPTSRRSTKLKLLRQRRQSSFTTVRPLPKNSWFFAPTGFCFYDPLSQGNCNCHRGSLPSDICCTTARCRKATWTAFCGLGFALAASASPGGSLETGWRGEIKRPCQP